MLVYVCARCEMGGEDKDRASEYKLVGGWLVQHNDIGDVVVKLK